MISKLKGMAMATTAASKAMTSDKKLILGVSWKRLANCLSHKKLKLDLSKSNFCKKDL
jgi:hypothetical protein